MPITMDNMRILLSMVLLFSILVTVDDMTVLRILYVGEAWILWKYFVREGKSDNEECKGRGGWALYCMPAYITAYD